MSPSTSRRPASLPSILLAGLALLVCLAAPATRAEAPSGEALELRNRGLALLENEKPTEAAEVYRKLATLRPKDPLPWANLAVALLRQQKLDAALEAIGHALELAPGRADLLSIQGEVLSWTGKGDEALAVLEKAVAAAPDDVEVIYQLHRTAAGAPSDAADAAVAQAVERLRALRPENVVVLLESGRRAIAENDRTAATGAFLRLEELLWQVPNDTARKLLDQVLAALKAGDTAAAKVPAQRLENVLKITPMYQQSLRELWSGITGVPVQRFVGEPPPGDFGNPVRVRFTATAMDTRPTAGAALAVADFDGDQRPDVARLVAGDGGTVRLEVRRAAEGWKAGPLLAVGDLGRGDGAPRLLVADLDNDGARDLLAYGPKGARWFRGGGDGSFTDATAEAGLAGAGATAAVAVDLDIEGDLDLALAGGAAGGGDVYRNNLTGKLESVGAKMLPKLPAADADALLASDLDRDGDPDLLRVAPGGLLWLDNLRQGELVDHTAAGGLARTAGGRAATAADLDDDGYPDLVVAGDGGVTFLHNVSSRQEDGGRFRSWDLVAGIPNGTRWSAAVAFDADNDGRLDLALAGDPGSSGGPSIVVTGQRGGGRMAPIPVAGAPAAVTALAAADLDGDGDLDLVAAGPAGLSRLENVGGDANHWLAVHLEGLAQGSSKNNVFGVGSVVEVRDGRAYQFREADGGVVHFGLGKRPTAGVLRVVWPNGVPQDRLDVSADQTVVEEQLLKGSCPFLYTWDGERVSFVTDLLWGAPIGLPVGPGVWAGADPSELVRVDGARPDAGGVYRMYVTEELWEAAFFDQVRLWVVDHPADVEVASALRVLPGRSTPDEVRASRDVHPVAAAWDARGVDVTERVRARDEVYADGYVASRYQGVAAKPWTMTFDLGEVPDAERAHVRLHLDGWIFPTDASLNLALAQRRDLSPQNPRLEVETAGGWQVLMGAADFGFPAGKTKTLVVDLPPLPPGAHKLRIVTNLWLGWDRIAWSGEPDDGAARVVARLAPASSDLHYRGFSALERRAPNAPHHYDYARVSTRSPWLPFPGHYTRYGDVGELLATVDDRSVVLGPGDEIALRFDASRLPAPPPGWRRTVFLESHGWDKDADRNTAEPQHVEPLPFRAMTGYPYGPDEHFPDGPEYRRYLAEWQTREVVAPAPTDVRPLTERAK